MEAEKRRVEEERQAAAEARRVAERELSVREEALKRERDEVTAKEKELKKKVHTHVHTHTNTQTPAHTYVVEFARRIRNTIFDSTLCTHAHDTCNNALCEHIRHVHDPNTKT